MSYESKVIFKAVMDILKTSSTLEEAMERVADVANVEDVIVTPSKKIKKDESNAD
jgi:ribosomal protein S2